MSKSIFWGKLEKYFKMLSAEIITQHAQLYQLKGDKVHLSRPLLSSKY